jgi:deoxyribodipyrimidine photo-lyase
MKNNTSIAICWLRRDLRLEDNAAMYHALKSGYAVLPLFIFDKNILDKLTEKADRRVTFIHQTLQQLQQQLSAYQSSLLVKYGTPIEIWKNVIDQYDVKAVYTNHDFEPYALERDKNVKQLLEEKNIPFFTYKDHVIFEKDEVLSQQGKPYTVFTPYSKTWKAKLNDFYVKSYPTLRYAHQFYKTEKLPLPSLSDMKFVAKTDHLPSANINENIIKNYSEQRNFPAKISTSRLGIHLRFGTISIRQLAQKAITLNETFLNELIWRDFYAMILAQFPYVAVRSFRPDYDKIEWRNNQDEFERWCNGQTGYPIVDAGMRELNETGFMHNRVRMITASFLTKHLLIDWRWGEAYFAAKLNDFDLASNNGGWQWAAGSGTDAAPYFRIFNPSSQTEKFDPKLEYIKQWVKEIGKPNYPIPMVEHNFARNRCLVTYKKALQNNTESELFGK